MPSACVAPLLGVACAHLQPLPRPHGLARAIGVPVVAAGERSVEWGTETSGDTVAAGRQDAVRQVSSVPVADRREQPASLVGVQEVLPVRESGM